MANDSRDGNHAVVDHKRFYSSFIGTMKWSVVVIAMLLIALAVFLVR